MLGNVRTPESGRRMPRCDKLHISYRSSVKAAQSVSNINEIIFNDLLLPGSQDVDALPPDMKMILKVIHHIANTIRNTEDFKHLDNTWVLQNLDCIDSKFLELAKSSLTDNQGLDLPSDERLLFRALTLFVYAADICKLVNDAEIIRVIQTTVCETVEQYAVNWKILLQIGKFPPFLSFGVWFCVNVLLFGIHWLSKMY